MTFVELPLMMGSIAPRKHFPRKYTPRLAVGDRPYNAKNPNIHRKRHRGRWLTSVPLNWLESPY